MQKVELKFLCYIVIIKCPICVDLFLFVLRCSRLYCCFIAEFSAVIYRQTLTWCAEQSFFFFCCVQLMVEMSNVLCLKQYFIEISSQAIRLAFGLLTGRFIALVS